MQRPTVFHPEEGNSNDYSLRKKYDFFLDGGFRGFNMLYNSTIKL
jgi:hypothetical protein